jgi:hypothetical protein
MSDEKLGELYRRMLARPRPDGRGGCPSPDALRSVAEREADAEARLAIMEHVSGCADCQRELALLGQVADTVRRPARPVPAWWLAAAASVVLAVVGGRALLTRGGVEPVVRGDAPAVMLVAPSGAVRTGSAATLVWRAVPDALRYEVEVLGPEAELVQSATVRDTVVPLGGGLESGVEYRWRVTAVRRDGTRLESPLLPFTLTRD